MHIYEFADPKSQKDVDIKKHELEEKIRSLRGVVAPSPLTTGTKF